MLQQVKALLMKMASHIGAQVQVPVRLILSQFPSNTPGRQKKVTQMLGPFLPIWDIQMMKFQLPSFSLIQPKDLSLPLLLSQNKNSELH